MFERKVVKTRYVDLGVAPLENDRPDGETGWRQTPDALVVEIHAKLRHPSTRLALEKLFEIFSERGILTSDDPVSDSDQAPHRVSALQVLEVGDPLKRCVVLGIQAKVQGFAEVFRVFFGIVFG